MDPWVRLWCPSWSPLKLLPDWTAGPDCGAHPDHPQTAACPGPQGLIVVSILITPQTDACPGPQGLIVVSILIINTLLFYISSWLTDFEKHHTRSSEACSLAHKLFLSQARQPQARRSAGGRSAAQQPAPVLQHGGAHCAVLSGAPHPTVTALASHAHALISACPPPLLLPSPPLQFLNSALSTIVASAYIPWLRPFSAKMGGFFFQARPTATCTSYPAPRLPQLHLHPPPPRDARGCAKCGPTCRARPCSAPSQAPTPCSPPCSALPPA